MANKLQLYTNVFCDSAAGFVVIDAAPLKSLTLLLLPLPLRSVAACAACCA